jgi:hypothetical protein
VLVLVLLLVVVVVVLLRSPTDKRHHCRTHSNN